MSLTYGSTNKLQVLPRNLIAKPLEEKKPHQDDLKWLSWFITGLNIGITLLSLGTSLPTQAIIGAGLGSITTAAEAAITIKTTGKINPLTFGINIAATILPTSFAIRKIRKIKKLKELGQTSAQTFSKAIKALKQKKPTAFKNFKTGIDTKYIANLNPLKKKSDLDKLFKIVKLGQKINLKKKIGLQFNKRLIQSFDKKIVSLTSSTTTINKYEKDLNNFIAQNFKNLSKKDSYWIKSSLISGIENQKFSPTLIERNLKTLIRGKTFLSDNGKLAIKKFIKSSEEKLDPFISGSINISKKATQEKWTLNKIIRYTGSREFNDKVVQKVQWIDANDLGRAPIEFTYQKLKKVIHESQEAIIKKFSRLRKAAKIVEKASKINYQGLTVLGGSYLWSFRPLQITKAGYKKRIPCIMNFNKFETGKSKDPTTKNYGGKKSIIFWATRGELYRIWKEGVSYWYSPHNKKKGWWLNRGGKNPLIAVGISRPIALWLNFIPIASLRFINSMISNLVENVHSISEGTYQQEWNKKFFGALDRAIKNRAGRIISKNIFGGFARKLIKGPSGQYIEKIAWGVGTVTTNTLQGKGTLKRNIQTQSKAKFNTFGRIAVKKGGGKETHLIKSHSDRRMFKISRATSSAVIKGRVKIPKWKF